MLPKKKKKTNPQNKQLISSNTCSKANLAVQARVYLAIPATSVPSERLFSSAGNVFAKKRNRLNQNNLHNILFLRENYKLFDQ